MLPNISIVFLGLSRCNFYCVKMFVKSQLIEMLIKEKLAKTINLREMLELAGLKRERGLNP